MRKIGLLFIFLICLFSTAEAQKFLLLQKGNKQKSRIAFEIGESISYKSSKYPFFIRDVITDIQPNLLVMKENILKPSDIQEVFIKNKDPRNQTIKNLSYISLGAGALWMTAESVNSLYQEGNLERVKDSWPFGLGLIGTGIIVSKLQYKTFKNKGKNKIQTIILYEEDL